jgi:hypothetical protein
MPILVAVRDLVFRSKIQAAADRLGVPLTLVPRGAPLADSSRNLGGGMILVDLNEPGVLEQIAAAKAAGGARVVGFLGHLQADLIEAAEAAGTDVVLTRGQFVARLDELLRAGA